MRSAVLGIALVAVGLGAFRFAVPALFEHAIDGGGESCDGSHLTSTELEAFVPDDAQDVKQVYRTVQHCASGDTSSEAAISLAYASERDVQATAGEMLAGAERTGWARVSPPPGRPVTATNGTVTLALKRTGHGQTVHFDASVFPSASKPNPDPNANISKILANGAPTGVLLRIWVEGKSAIPTFDPGNLGLFPTPDIGIGR